MFAARYHFQFLIYESTTVSDKTCLIIYIRWCPLGSDDAVNFFLDLIEVERANADGITSALLGCLYSHGFTDMILSEFWLGLATDGASVMTGNRSGVATVIHN